MDRDGGWRAAQVPAAARRVLIVTDAWRPQTNGVVRTLEALGRELERRSIEVRYLTPERFWTLPVPTYPEIRLSLATQSSVAAFIDGVAPQHIHIATEGPLGLQARQYCLDRGLAFTTSFHTRFPEYLAARVPVHPDWSYGYFRWFHEPAVRTLVPTPSLLAELSLRGLDNLVLWSRGVDASRFAPGPKSRFLDLAGPHLLYVGRIAAEKSVEDFLRLDHPGTKIVVGDGPDRAALERDYPEAVFLGYQFGEELAALYRSADVFVFPSRTDTFGNVVIEALASGLPVAAYPVTGPKDILAGTQAGALDDDLGAAVARALTLSRQAARRLGESFTYAASASQFLMALAPVGQMVSQLAHAG
ncbi:glycosyltransferase family 4 protein [uncultured Devosia sp.]|uniref:glycosyltransferase family 4 protein n=1 Tax=uncultured Devosia sp. TaxID=211434 RepID=UPI0035C99F62